MENLNAKARNLLIKNIISTPDTFEELSRNRRIRRLLDLLYLIDSNAHMDEVALIELLSEVLS